MAYQVYLTAAQFTSDAEFRAWGKAISDGIAAMGQTRRAESGQVNWTTVTKPTLASTVAGFDCFAFADAFQATAPVVYKLEYGTGNSANAMGLWLTVGSGTDGAGNVTGVIIARRQIGQWTTSTTVSPTLIAGSTNWIGVFVATGVVTHLFHLERTHDASGADTDLGVLASVSGTWSGQDTSQYLARVNIGTISNEGTLGALAPSTGSGSIGSQTMVFPIFPAAGPFLNPFLNVLIMFAANSTTWVPFPMSHYGATRTYIPLPTTTLVRIRGAVTGLCYVVRCE